MNEPYIPAKRSSDEDIARLLETERKRRIDNAKPLLDRLDLDAEVRELADQVVGKDDGGLSFVMEAARVNRDLSDTRAAYQAGVKEWLEGLLSRS